MSGTTRQRLIDAAIRHFYDEGFRSAGLDQIIADVGISKTAFYKHFASKDDLMLAALECKGIWLQETFRQMVWERGGATAIGQLRAVFDVVEMILKMDQFQGCIFVRAAMEFPLPQEPVFQEAGKNRLAIEEFLRQLAEHAGANDPGGLADQLCLIMEGAYVTQHVTGNRNTISVARHLADLAIASALGEAARDEPTEGELGLPAP